MSVGVASRWSMIAPTRSLNDCTRKTGPYPNWLSAAENPGDGLLFQFVKKPAGGLIARGCTSALERSVGTKPFQSYGPVPHDGKLGSTRGARIGIRPAM